jgi:hypothetical protein
MSYVRIEFYPPATGQTFEYRDPVAYTVVEVGQFQKVIATAPILSSFPSGSSVQALIYAIDATVYYTVSKTPSTSISSTYIPAGSKVVLSLSVGDKIALSSIDSESLTVITGPQGEEGPIGPIGPQGIQGNKGDQGDVGPVGPQGAQGNRGDKGDIGNTGPAGPQGTQGPQGIQGEKGDKGDKGADGLGSGNVNTTGTTNPNDVVLFAADSNTIKSGGPLATVATSGSYNDLSNKPTTDGITEGSTNQYFTPSRAQSANTDKAVKSANLSDLTNIATARTNLGLTIGSDVQAYDSDLAAIAALTTTSYGRSLLTAADSAGARVLLALGTLATQNSVTASQISDASANGRSLITATDYTAIKTLLNLVIGANVQAWDSDLDAIAALSTTPFGRSLLTIADAASTRTALGLGSLATQSSITTSQISDVNASIRTLLKSADYAAFLTTLELRVGADIQQWTLDLDALSTIGSTAYGRNLLTLANQPALATAAGVPSKGLGTDIRTLTDDTKFLTSKSMSDAMAFTAATWAASFAPNWSTNGFNQTLVATGNTTFTGPFTGGSDGEPIIIEFVQDATGSRTIAFNTAYFKLPPALSITASTAANTRDVLYGYLRLVSGTLVCRVTGYDKAVP